MLGVVSYFVMLYLIGDKKESLKMFNIDGVELIIENIVFKKYLFWFYEYMIINGELKDGVKEYIDYVVGKDFVK